MSKKKSEFIDSYQNGKLKKVKNINENCKISNIIEKIDKDVNLEKIKEKIYIYENFILIFKKFSRDHKEKNEKFRSRYSKNDLKKFTKIFEEHGKFIIILSYYDAGDKIILVATEITSLLFTKKDKIKSDGRIITIDNKDIEKAYKEPISRLEINKGKTVYFANTFHVDEFKTFFDKIKKRKITFYDYEKKHLTLGLGVKDEAATIWRKMSFNKMKDWIEKGDKNKFIGELGEYIAFINLQNNDDTIIWSSKLFPSANHDININDEKFYEIKSKNVTKKSVAIKLSNAEKKFMKSKNKWFLYLLFLNNLIKEIDFKKEKGFFENEDKFNKFIKEYKIFEKIISKKEFQKFDKIETKKGNYRYKYNE